MKRSTRGILYASLTALMWAILAIALKVILKDLPPVTVSWFRFALAFLFLSIYYLIIDKKKLAILYKPPLYAIIAAILLGLNYIGFIVGLNFTTPIVAQIFIQIGPVLLALSGFMLFREKISIRQGLGFLIVLIGLLLFYNEKILLLTHGLAAFKTGVLWLIFGAFAWSGYAIFQKKAVVSYNPMQLNLVLFGLPSLFLLPFVSFNLFGQLDLSHWLILIFLGLNTLVSYVALAYALKFLEANKISVIITLNPILTIILMFFLTKWKVSWINPEDFSVLTLLGSLTVLIGVILAVMNGNSRNKS